MLAFPGRKGKGSGLPVGVIVELPSTMTGAEAVWAPEVNVAVTVVDERTAVSVTRPPDEAVVGAVVGAKLIDAAKGTLFMVIVVVSVRFTTWAKATGLGEMPTPLQDVKSRKSMKACSAAASTVTRPDADGRTWVKAEDKEEREPELVLQPPPFTGTSDVILKAENTL